MSLLRLNCFKAIRPQYAVTLLASFCICALVSFALAQSSTSKPPGTQKPNSNGKIKISTAIECSGGCTKKTEPVYPPLAKAAKISGTVVLEATISKTGIISDLRVISGPALLQQASLDAVKTWRYRPYLLNGVPMETKTAINVVFALGENGAATAKVTATTPRVARAAPQADGAAHTEDK